MGCAHPIIFSPVPGAIILTKIGPDLTLNLNCGIYSIKLKSKSTTKRCQTSPGPQIDLCHHAPDTTSDSSRDSNFFNRYHSSSSFSSKLLCLKIVSCIFLSKPLINKKHKVYSNVFLRFLFHSSYVQARDVGSIQKVGGTHALRGTITHKKALCKLKKGTLYTNLRKRGAHAPVPPVPMSIVRALLRTQIGWAWCCGPLKTTTGCSACIIKQQPYT